VGCRGDGVCGMGAEVDGSGDGGGGGGEGEDEDGGEGEKWERGARKEERAKSKEGGATEACRRLQPCIQHRSTSTSSGPPRPGPANSITARHGCIVALQLSCALFSRIAPIAPVPTIPLDASPS
jgi:hypothetical protein